MTVLRAGAAVPFAAERARGGSLREALATLAPLFSYPSEEMAGPLASARKALAGACPPALAPFDRFARWAETTPGSVREETYSATFDLSPSCPPYLGVHLFEGESPERARLMVGLRQVAERAGRRQGSELPDHLAEVLAGAEAFSAEEWHELARLCLVPALARMAEQLGPAGNPYHHLLAAGHLLAKAVAEKGEAP